jgi:uncharacterized membrane protein YhiD involved in acid resistance
VVALVYRATRPSSEVAPSFTATLVLLSILIAMVTQVIGDNVARAFSLVGALSIVRFRTVVRDTQDTAYVIFAVAVGMAVGASHPSVAVSGVAIVGLAAWVMRSRGGSEKSGPAALYLVEVRVGLGHDPEDLVRDLLNTHAIARRLTSIGTAKQGMSIEISYEAQLRSESAASELVKALNKIEGVQNVTVQRIVGEG